MSEIDVDEVGEFGPGSAAPGTPVFELSTESGSYITVAFLPDDVEELDARVFHAVSEEKGDLRRLMNEVSRRWYTGDPISVAFANVVTELMSGRDLDEALEGFDRETTVAQHGPMKGEEYEELRGTWRPSRARA